MKIELQENYKDQKYSVGYEYIPTEENPDGELMFWIDGENECVTLCLDKQQMKQLIAALIFLKDNV